MNSIKNIKPITVDAFILGYKREKNLAQVIDGLRRQRFVKDIFLFHNHPSHRKVEGVHNIVSELNFGCIARHAIALLTDSPFALFVDDDTQLLTDFSQRFSQAVSISKHSVIGLFGSNINAKYEEKHYSNRWNYFYSDFFRFTDIVVGRVHLCTKEALVNSFRFLTSHRFKIDGLREGDFIMDDIILNIANQMEYKVPSLIIPCKKEEVLFLSSEFGSELDPSHYHTRDQLIRESIQMGWRPKSSFGKFRQWNIDNGGKQTLTDARLLDINYYIQQKNIQAVNKLLNKIPGPERKKIPLPIKYNMAGLYRDNGHIEQAQKLYKEITHHPSNSTLIGPASYHLGVICLNQGHKEAALAYFRTCIQHVPQHRKAQEALTNSQ